LTAVPPAAATISQLPSLPGNQQTRVVRSVPLLRPMVVKTKASKPKNVLKTLRTIRLAISLSSHRSKGPEVRGSRGFRRVYRSSCGLRWLCSWPVAWPHRAGHGLVDGAPDNDLAIVGERQPFQVGAQKGHPQGIECGSAARRLGMRGAPYAQLVLRRCETRTDSDRQRLSHHVLRPPM